MNQNYTDKNRGQGRSSRESYIRALGREHDMDIDAMNQHARQALNNTRAWFKPNLLDRIERATSNSNMTWDQRGQAIKEEYEERTKALERLRQQVERKKNLWD